MARGDGEATRTALMDAAEALILESGFSAASVDKIIGRAGVTKGAFFYHFESKGALGRALVDRYAALDLAHLDANMTRAEALSRDPLQQLLIFVGLFEEAWGTLTEPYPGCLFASYLAEAGLFDAGTMQVIEDAMLAWRRRLGDKLREITAKRQPRLEIDVDAVADMMTVLFEGSFIVSRTLNEPKLVAAQVRNLRNYLELLFAESPS